MQRDHNQRGYQISLAQFFHELRVKDKHFDETAPTAASFCKARKKLRFEVVENICKSLAQKQESLAGPRGLWLGHKVYGLDGTRLTLPNSVELEEHFSKHRLPCGDAYYPQAYLVAAMNLFSGGVLAAIVDDQCASERGLIEALLPNFEKGSVLVVDRIASYRRFFYKTQKFGLHYVTRVKTSNTLQEFIDFYKSGKMSAIVEVHSSKKENIPAQRVRLVRGPYNLEGEAMLLATDLLDTENYTDEALLALYRDRWEIETLYNRVKNILKVTSFHARSYNGIMQEIFCAFIFNNITRCFVASANESKRSVDKASIKAAHCSVGRYLAEFFAVIAQNIPRQKQMIKEIIEEIQKTWYRYRPDRRYRRYSKQPINRWSLARARKKP